MKKTSLFFLTILLNAPFSFAHDEPWSAARPDGHAPISVMGDHMHTMGEWMVSYRFMTMEMEGLLDGSNDISASDANTTYGYNKMMLPKSMTMDMHMFGAMHAISDKWTLMCMLHYLDNEMTMQGSSMGKMESNGIGDLKIAGLYDLARWDSGRRIHLNIGLSLPTGSIDEKSGNNTLGYGMQLGSGTWDFHPAVTYLAKLRTILTGHNLEEFFELEKMIRITPSVTNWRRDYGELVRLLIPLVHQQSLIIPTKVKSTVLTRDCPPCKKT